jgi:hypothetical protein
MALLIFISQSCRDGVVLPPFNARSKKVIRIWGSLFLSSMPEWIRDQFTGQHRTYVITACERPKHLIIFHIKVFL